MADHMNRFAGNGYRGEYFDVVIPIAAIVTRGEGGDKSLPGSVANIVDHAATATIGPAQLPGEQNRNIVIIANRGATVGNWRHDYRRDPAPVVLLGNEIAVAGYKTEARSLACVPCIGPVARIDGNC